MSTESLYTQFPTVQKALNAPFAKDIRLNLSSLLAGTEPVKLSRIQIAALVLAAAYATRQKTVIQYFEAYAREQELSEADIHGVKAAVSIMAMNNVYYRSIHLIQNETYARLPAKLRMNILQQHGISQQDFELYSVVVSAINGCGRCLDAHISVLEKGGIGTAEIQYSLRIASVIQAVAQLVVLEEAV